MIATLKNRLLHELRASTAKSAVLAMLFLVGIYFWIPPLWRAIGFDGDAATAKASPAAAGSIIPPTAPPVSGSTTTPHVSPVGVVWDRAAAVLDRDPLVKSAEVATIGGDPFRIDDGQFPPPILFAEGAAAPPLPEVESPPAELPSDVVLRGTIIGRARRAALINTRLYHEGAKVRVGGESYHLEEIHPRRAILSRGGQRFELKIPGPIDFEALEEQTPNPT